MEKHSQYMYLSKDLYQDHINNSYKSTFKSPTTQSFQMGKRLKQVLKYIRMANKHQKVLNTLGRQENTH